MHRYCMNVKCKICNKEFHKKPSQVRENNFCSIECTNKHRCSRTVIPCDFCGKEITKVKNELRPHNFCDRTCYSSWSSRTITGERHHRYIPERPCEECQTMFKPNQATSKYCSRECHHQGMRKAITLCCSECQTSFEACPSAVKWAKERGSKKSFCSSDCSKKHHKKENHPSWLEDRNNLKNPKKSLRESTEMQEWRKTVFSRDNWTCLWCGDRSRSKHKVVLNAHHIKRVADFPDSAFHLSNGITLCESCHKKTYQHEPDFEKMFNTMLEANSLLLQSNNEEQVIRS